MNRSSRRTCIALALLLAAPAQAQTSSPQTPAPPARPATPGVHARVEQAFSAARQRVLAGSADEAARDELVAAIRGAYGALAAATPDTLGVRARLVAEVEDLFTRARFAHIAAEELDALHVDLLDARLCDTLAETERNPTESGLDPLAAAVRELAEAAQPLDPATADWRARAESRLAALRRDKKFEPAAFSALRELFDDARAERAETLLERHALDKGASPSDFARARNALSDRLETEAQKSPEARELQKKLVAAIDALQKRAAEGALTHADFEALRQQMTHRARAVLAEKTSPRG